jgi:hypothetical protein
MVEGFSKHLATVRVPAAVSLARLRSLLTRIPFMPKHYQFLRSDKVSPSVCRSLAQPRPERGTRTCHSVPDPA